MESLPLYNEVPESVIEQEIPLDLDPKCTRCPHHERTRQPCMPAAGNPQQGAVLVIGDGPTQDDARSNRPFSSMSGRVFRQRVQKILGDRPVMYDNAVRCPAGRAIELDDVDKCRPFLATTVSDIDPERIVVVGPYAAYAVLGRTVNSYSVRRGYGWIRSELGRPIPVFFILNPIAATKNPFVMRWMEQDLQWALTVKLPNPEQWASFTNVVTTWEESVEACAELRAAKWFSFDVETAGIQFEPTFRILSLAACAQGASESWTWDADALADPLIRKTLTDLLSDPTVAKVGQNVKYDALSVRCAWGTEVVGIHGDTRLWRRLLEPHAAADLATMAELVGLGGHKNEARSALHAAGRARRKAEKAAQLLFVEEDEIEKRGFGSEDYAYLPRDVLLRYNALDAVATTRLGELLEARVAQDPAIHKVWSRLVRPAIEAITQVEWWGFAADRTATQAFRTYILLQKQEVGTRLRNYGDFNPDSNRDVGKLLYDQLGLPTVKTTGTGKPSSDREALELLKGRHPVAGDLLEWRRLAKMEGTYATGLLGFIRPDGRIHCTYNIDGARSGRMSSSGPNLQNIPRASNDETRMARDCFVAPPGYVLLQADYSQLEIRVAAALSGDVEMKRIFEEKMDFHQRTAEFIAPIVWKIDASQVQKEHRSGAKAFNFGIMYGMSDEGIARRAGCTPEEAMRIRQAVMGKFKQFAKWIDDRVRETRQTGVTWTWWDHEKARCRPLWEIGESSDRQARVKAEHGAFNTPVQGTASDFCLASVVETVQWLLREKNIPAKLVCTVHDSIVLEVRKDYVPVVKQRLHEIMCGWPSNGVPLEVDFEIGTSWGGLQKYEPGLEKELG